MLCLQTSEQENEQRRRLELAALQNNNSEDVIKRNKLNQKRQQVTPNKSPRFVRARGWADIHSMILARTNPVG